MGAQELPTFLWTTALQRKLIYRAVAHKGVGGLVDGPLPAYGPVTELSGFLSFQFSG